MKKILIVDDSETFRKLFIRIFAKNNSFKIVEEASSGKEALAAVSGGFFDIILLDLSMPDMDGLDFLAKIRKDFKGKIVILSGIPRLDMESHCAKLGADLYIEKGDSIEHIFSLLEGLY